SLRSSFYYSVDHWDLHSFPTRRSSDLGTLSQRIEGFLMKKNHRRSLISVKTFYILIFNNPMFSTNQHTLFFIILTLLTVPARTRSEEHTSELQSRFDLVCRLLLEKKNT